MLRTNLSYAATMRAQNAIQATIADAVASAMQSVSNVNIAGWRVFSSVDQAIRGGNPFVPVSFDQTDFDYINNVQSPTTFVVQQAGSYQLAGVLNWGSGIGGKSVSIVVNGQIVYSTDTNSAGPISLPFSTLLALNAKDAIAIQATSDSNETILAGSEFDALLNSSAIIPTSLGTAPNTAGILTFTAGADFPAMTAVYVQSDGTVVPVDPTVVNFQGSPPSVFFPYPDGVATESGLAGQSVNIGTQYGATFSGSHLTPGGLLYVGPGGLLTQDFDTLITEVQWIICVGRAVTSDTFVYEPHIPSRFVETF